MPCVSGSAQSPGRPAHFVFVQVHKRPRQVERDVVAPPHPPELSPSVLCKSFHQVASGHVLHHQDSALSLQAGTVKLQQGQQRQVMTATELYCAMYSTFSVVPLVFRQVPVNAAEIGLRLKLTEQQSGLATWTARPPSSVGQ